MIQEYLFTSDKYKADLESMVVPEKVIKEVAAIENSKCCVTKLNFVYAAGHLKSFSDFYKIFAVNSQGFIRFPDSFSVFHNCTVFYTIMFSRIFSSYIRKMKRSIFIVINTNQKNLSVQVIKTAQRRTFAKNIFQSMIFCKENSIFSICSNTSPPEVSSKVRLCVKLISP